MTVMSARSMRKQQSLQSGQAIVLMALAMMGLLAFVVLAIDGGRFYTQRRKSQNASDMSSLAGLYRYAKAADPSTLKDSDVLSEINRVAEINEIADTNATKGDAINANVQAWWVDKTGGIIRQMGGTYMNSAP